VAELSVDYAKQPGALAMYGRYILTSFKAQMQYKVSFLLNVIAQLAATGLGVVGIWALFSRFGSLDSWTMHQVLVFYGVVNISFAIADAVATGFDKFGSDYIRLGQLDRLLLRPRSLMLQLLGHELALRRIGGLSQGVVVLIWGLSNVDAAFTLSSFVLLLYIIVCAICLFIATFILQATLTFWTVESIEVMNTLTYGGVEASQYPFSIYEDWFRRIFTYIVPLACVTYFPVLVLLDIDDPIGTTRLFQLTCPMLGVVFLGVSIAMFEYVGVRHYTSTGS
jgi:ABC-2 type transport system permease protein